MTGTVYSVCVERLERLLSPRVVSRTLRMEMKPEGLSPETVTAAELEPILKGAVFRQLQVVMPADQAREALQDVLATLLKAEEGGEPAGESGGTGDAEGAGDVDAEAAPSGRAAEEAASAAQARLAALRAALRPYNLYFEWPEVRRLRAQLQRLEDEILAGNDASALAEEADAQLAVVASKLEDLLVLQAKDLAELDEAVAEVQGLGGPKVRRLDALVKHVHEAQANRQLVDAEIERARKLARDLRKLMASSVYASSEAAGESAAPSPEEIDARMKALDLEGEAADLAALAREHAVLLEYEPALAARLREVEEGIAAGRSSGTVLPALREEAAAAERLRRQEVEAELDEAARTLERLPEGAAGDVVHEADVLRGVLENGLPPRSELVRFRDLLALAVERADRAGRHAEEDAREARARLDAQGERLARARSDLLRHADDTQGPLLDRLRDAVDRLARAQAEERLDPELDAEVRELAAAFAEERWAGGDGDGAESREQARSLLARLDGLPSLVDPEGSAQLRRDLESWLRSPPDEAELAAGAAAVATFVARVRADARARLDRAGAEAARWGLHDVLGAVQAANERLEDGRDPELGSLERRLDEEREAVRAAQLERLHRAEREAGRLTGIDDADEAHLQNVLARGRTQIAEGRPAVALGEIEELLRRLEATLARRIADVMPRLDAAINAFRRVERLNSEDVATVRRILLHLDAQRDAFTRISPGMRARLERSLQEAEDLLGSLEEEERATRAIADRLMSGNHFDDLLGLFGEPDAGGGASDPAPAPPGTNGSSRAGASENGADHESDAERWVAARAGARGTVAAALFARERGAVAARGLPADAGPVWAEVTGDLLATLDRLGGTLGLGRLRLATVERSSGSLLLGARDDAAALVVSEDPAGLGLLARDVREDESWPAAVRAGDPPEAGRDLEPASVDVSDDDRGPS